MKKIREDYFEYLFSKCYDVFELSSKEKITFQQLYFIYLCDNNFYSIGFFTNDKKNKLKENYLKWQNKESPSKKWISNKINNSENVSFFSHDFDYSWNTLEKFIYSYIDKYCIQIGCLEEKDALRISILID